MQRHKDKSQTDASAGIIRAGKASVALIGAQWWRNGALRSEVRFREMMLGIVGLAHEHALAGEIEAAEELREIYCRVEPHCIDTELAASYDHGLIMFGMLLAECAALYRQWADAYRLAAEARELVRDIRRRDPRRRHSEALWVTARVLADVKWQEPEGNRDRLITPEQLVAEYREIERHVRAELPGIPEDRRADIVESLAWTGLAMCKLAVRFLSTRQLAQLVSHCGMAYGAALRCDVGHCRYGNGPPPGHATFYWDYEICKLWLAGELTLDELDDCHRARVLAAEAEGHSAPLYRRALELEYAAMAPSCQRQLELLNA